MKTVSTILVTILFIMAGFIGCKQSDTQSNDLITVNVTKTDYQKKELILQDFMDVEYIALETKDSFLNQGFVLDVGEKIILVKNRNEDGNIFIYDRAGKAIRKINRKGQGSEEYISNAWVKLDEENEEIYVNSHFSKKILVYDLYGNFKRSFKAKEGGGSLFYSHFFNFDKDHLICYDVINEEIPFVLISKRDGSISKEIKPPFEEKKLLMQVLRDEESGQIMLAEGPGSFRSVIPYSNGNWILSDVSSDTVFQLLPDYSLLPVMVRTPTIQSMDPEVCLTLRLLSDRYYFMEIIKNEYNWETGEGFPKNYQVYDRQKKAIYNYTVYNGDFSTKKEIYMSMTEPLNHEIESWYPLDAHLLVDSHEKGELKGKLKEVAATLSEDDNPVIMLIKHKK